MSKTIATENAPAAIGPYVQGVDLGNMIITSGQIPVNPKTGEVPADVDEQSLLCLQSESGLSCPVYSLLPAVTTAIKSFHQLG